MLITTRIEIASNGSIVWGGGGGRWGVVKILLIWTAIIIYIWIITWRIPKYFAISGSPSGSPLGMRFPLSNSFISHLKNISSKLSDEIWWNVLKYFEIHWDMLRSWNVMRSVEMCWDVMRYVEMCWDLMRYVVICWDLLRSDEMCWDVLRCVEMCWDVSTWWTDCPVHCQSGCATLPPGIWRPVASQGGHNCSMRLSSSERWRCVVGCPLLEGSDIHILHLRFFFLLSKADFS